LKKIGKPVARVGAAAERTAPLVLYVEDEDSNWEVTQLRLGRGYELIRAATDKEACSVVRRYGAKLSAVLMDIQLSGSKLDGVQLTRLLRGTLPADQVPSYGLGLPALGGMPIIFVTAYGARYIESDLINAGGNKLVTKPVDFSVLNLALVSFHLGRANRK
jgi:CheY-like chemotaxis protein